MYCKTITLQLFLSMKLTTAEVVSKLKSVNATILILGEYKSAHSPLVCKCAVCTHTWSPTWASLNKNHGCPKCTKRIPLSTQEVKRRLHDLNPLIKILGKYRNHTSPLHCKCLKCNHNWWPTWNKISQGRGCPKCGRERMKKSRRLTQEQAKQTLQKISPTIELLGEYVNAHSVIKCKCKSCLHIWYPRWHNLKFGFGCPKCGSDCKSENEIRSIIERLTGAKFPRATPSEVPFLHGLHLDGYDQINKRAFEADGGQHKEIVPRFHGKTKAAAKRGFLKQKRRDWRKNIQCWRHGIQLIRIPSSIRNKEAYITRKLKRIGWIKIPA